MAKKIKLVFEVQGAGGAEQSTDGRGRDGDRDAARARVPCARAAREL